MRSDLAAENGMYKAMFIVISAVCSDIIDIIMRTRTALVGINDREIAVECTVSGSAFNKVYSSACDSYIGISGKDIATA